MLKRLTLLAAVGALASACADNPAPAPGPGITSPAGTPSLASPGAATVLNIAASSQWAAEERLMPQDPILALINTGGSADAPQGFLMTCNPSNGVVTAKLGKQATGRVGQEAIYHLRFGAQVKDVEGKFAINPKSPDADFVFAIPSNDLLAISQLDMMSVVTDQGEVQWAFVKDPAVKVQAKYIASLKDMPTQTHDFMAWCNPK